MASESLMGHVGRLHWRVGCWADARSDMGRTEAFSPAWALARAVMRTSAWALARAGTRAWACVSATV